MPVPDRLDWLAHSRNFIEFLARWGAQELSTLGPIFKGVLPVVVVDRFRGPDEGNIWVINVETGGAANEFSAVGIVSNDPNSDWELLALTFNWIPFFDIAGIDHGFHICTPLVGAVDPVLNNFLGGFQAGLITDLNVTASTLRGFSGTNPGLVLPLGEIHRPNRSASDIGPLQYSVSETVDFSPPPSFLRHARGDRPEH